MAKKSNTGWYVALVALVGGAFCFITRKAEGPVPPQGPGPTLDELGIDTRFCKAVEGDQVGDPTNPALWRVYKCFSEAGGLIFTAAWRGPNGGGSSTPYDTHDEAAEVARQRALSVM